MYTTYSYIKCLYVIVIDLVICVTGRQFDLKHNANDEPIPGIVINTWNFVDATRQGTVFCNY